MGRWLLACVAVVFGFFMCARLLSSRSTTNTSTEFVMPSTSNKSYGQVEQSRDAFVSWVWGVAIANMDGRPKNVLHQGVLEKRRPHGPGWQKRTFIITEDSISYYSEYKEGAVPKNTISFTETVPTIEVDSKRRAQNEFLIRVQGRDYRLRTKTKEDRDRWMTKLKAITKRWLDSRRSDEADGHIISDSSGGAMQATPSERPVEEGPAELLVSVETDKRSEFANSAFTVENISSVKKKLLHDAEKRNDAMAAYNYAWLCSRSSTMNTNAEEAKADLEQAITYYGKAAAGGLPIAHFNLGVLYARNPLDSRAMDCFRLAADLGDPDAQYNVGAMLLQTSLGKRVDGRVDLRESVAYLKKAYEQNHRRATFLLGEIYERMSTDHFIVAGDALADAHYTAMKYYLASAAHGDAAAFAKLSNSVSQIDEDMQTKPDALFVLGKMLRHGFGIERNTPDALRQLEMAVRLDFDHAEAAFEVAEMYRLREGIQGEISPARGQHFDEKAFQMYSRARNKNHSGAMVCLGYAFLHGIGCRRDRPQAYDLFVAAATAGNVQGMYQAALMLLDGVGVRARDGDRALVWLYRAAKRSYGPAILLLGILRTDEQFRLVPLDLVEGFAWLLKADEMGIQGAAERIDEVRPRLSGEQLREAFLRAPAIIWAWIDPTKRSSM